VLPGYLVTTGQSVASMLAAAYDTPPGHVQRAHWHVTNPSLSVFFKFATLNDPSLSVFL
jgi:hypothetical protein